MLACVTLESSATYTLLAFWNTNVQGDDKFNSLVFEFTDAVGSPPEPI